MQDMELLRMVAFKLQDTARRLENLAPEARTAAVRAHIARLARTLREHEATLWKLPAKQKTARLLRDADPARARRRAAS